MNIKKLILGSCLILFAATSYGNSEPTTNCPIETGKAKDAKEIMRAVLRNVAENNSYIQVKINEETGSKSCFLQNTLFILGAIASVIAIKEAIYGNTSLSWAIWSNTFIRLAERC